MFDFVGLRERGRRPNFDIVWWQNGDLGLGWVLEYIQRFIVDSGRWDPTYHKSD